MLIPQIAHASDDRAATAWLLSGDSALLLAGLAVLVPTIDYDETWSLTTEGSGQVTHQPVDAEVLLVGREAHPHNDQVRRRHHEQALPVVT